MIVNLIFGFEAIIKVLNKIILLPLPDDLVLLKYSLFICFFWRKWKDFKTDRTFLVWTKLIDIKYLNEIEWINSLIGRIDWNFLIKIEFSREF